MARVLCLDVGSRRTGVAVSDPTRTLARGLPTLEHRDEERLVALVDGLVREWEVACIVVGLPLSPDGGPTPRSEAVTRLAGRLRNRFKLPVEFQDERWTSNRAAGLLAETRGRNTGPDRAPAKGRSKSRKLAADRIAAVLILEDWLAEHPSPSSLTSLSLWFLLPLALLLLACTPGEPVEVRIPAGADTRVIAESLHARDIITSPALFRTAARVLDYDRRLRHGRFEIPRRSGTLAALQALSRPGRTAVTVTIPEGHNLRQIADLLDAHGVCGRAEFLAAARNHALLDSLGIPGPDAEGYLFPDTWEFETRTPAPAVIRRLARRFRQVWDRERARVADPPLDDRSTVILASIVEKEALRPDENRLIAGVFLNRLRKEMLLQSCATVQYVLPVHRQVLTLADTRVKSPYNTYLHPGLPPGPICSPGARALAAALDPESTEYLYFVARGDGGHIFSRTLREHLRAQRRISTNR